MNSTTVTYILVPRLNPNVGVTSFVDNLECGLITGGYILKKGGSSKRESFTDTRNDVLRRLENLSLLLNGEVAPDSEL